MKKILVVLAMLTVLLMTGCNKGNTTQTNEVQENQNNQQEQIENNTVADAKINSPFRSILEDIYDNHALPSGAKLYNMDSEEQLAENKFAIYDIDSDGKEELIFSYNSGAMADVKDFIFDYDENLKTVVVEAQFNPSPVTTYYDDGIVYEEHLHNQGNEDPWPYTLYQYNKTEDKYEIINKNEITGNKIEIPFKDFTRENIENQLLKALDIDKNSELGNGLIFKEKYWIIQDGDSEFSSLTTFSIYDSKLNLVYSINTDRLYEYRIDTDKFYFSNNENDYVKGISDVDKYYRVNYVLTEDNGKFIVEELNRDYENVIGPAGQS